MANIWVKVLPKMATIWVKVLPKMANIWVKLLPKMVLIWMLKVAYNGKKRWTKVANWTTELKRYGKYIAWCLDNMTIEERYCTILFPLHMKVIQEIDVCFLIRSCLAMQQVEPPVWYLILGTGSPTLCPSTKDLLSLTPSCGRMWQGETSRGTYSCSCGGRATSSKHPLSLRLSDRWKK